MVASGTGARDAESRIVPVSCPVCCPRAALVNEPSAATSMSATRNDLRMNHEMEFRT
jgi:hypothetical protein